MILILSDIHFGKSSYSEERTKEKDVVSLLQSYAGKIDRLYLLGDIFDHYVEYRYAIPKGFTRFLGCIAALADSGVEITYFLGNHDPWHKDFFETEFGANIVNDIQIEEISDKTVFLTHGDGKSASTGLYKSLKPILRHRLPTTLYKYLLPGDWGLGLARWSSRRYSAKETNMETVSLMRQYAFKKLSEGADIVIMGHCHFAELTSETAGVYLNTGSWYEDRTFGILDDDISLLKWQDKTATVLTTIPLT